MLWRSLIISVLLGFASGPAQAQSPNREDQDAAATDSDGAELRRAKELFDKALACESERRFDQAMEHYREIQQLFPANPLVHYRLGICQQRLGKKADAVKSFRAFLQTDYDGQELADGRSRLEELLLPALTRRQREKWEEAADYLQVASEMQLRIEVGHGDPPRLQSVEKAVKLLLGLKGEVPAYLPIDSRLGYAYQQMGDFTSAAAAYARYLKGFVELDFSPQDQREIRRRRIACEETIAIKQQEEQLQQKKAQEKDKKREVKLLEDTRAKNRQYLREHGTCTITGKSAGQVFQHIQTLSFDGDTLIVTSQSGSPPNKMSGTYRTTLSIRLNDIDANMLRYNDISQPEFSRVAFNIYILTVDGAEENPCGKLGPCQSCRSSH